MCHAYIFWYFPGEVGEVIGDVEDVGISVGRGQTMVIKALLEMFVLLGGDVLRHHDRIVQVFLRVGKVCYLNIVADTRVFIHDLFYRVVGQFFSQERVSAY